MGPRLRGDDSESGDVNQAIASGKMTFSAHANPANTRAIAVRGS
jgi:hypothetical protein